MVTMTCVCGATSKTFTKLTKADFPENWIQPCCDHAPSKEASKAPEPEEATKELETIEIISEPEVVKDTAKSRKAARKAARAAKDS